MFQIDWTDSSYCKEMLIIQIEISAPNYLSIKKTFKQFSDVHLTTKVRLSEHEFYRSTKS